MVENGKLLVAVAEDDPDDQLLMREAFKAIDPSFEISFFNNGKDLIDSLRECLLPKLILLDINMPVMNGWETLALIKKDFAFEMIPVVILTTLHIGKEELRLCSELGAKECVSKPASFSDFVDLLRSIAVRYVHPRR